jgi:hypothetical protein
VKHDRFWIHGLAAGATVGVLAEVLVMRLNPEVDQPLGSVAVGVLLWASWGALLAGLPIVALQFGYRRVTRRRNPWPAPGLTASVYLLAAILAAVNADLYVDLLSATARRVVEQDAVAWFLGALLAWLIGAVVRRTDGRAGWKLGFAVLMLLLPAGRLMVIPTTAAQPLAVVAEPIGSPTRPLVVIGVEGLDIPVLLTYSGGGRTPALERLMRDGAWGTVAPYEPFLRQSYWTTIATGAYPGAHGVKSHRGWRVPWFVGPLRLMPWTPHGSRLILPWGLPQQVEPPPATVPALWERIRLSNVQTEVVAWPGFWTARSGVVEPDADAPPLVLDDDLRRALEVALAAFERRSTRVWTAIHRDQRQLGQVVTALTGGAGNVWVHLESLAEARRVLEPLKPRHTGEREVIELSVELLDSQLQSVLAAAPPDALIVLVSPYGLSPPSSYERLRRLVGIGAAWHTSGDRCWDGVMMMMGRGVVRGRRLNDVRLPDVVPTSCYLLGLPVAQYMEGSVAIEAVAPEYLSTHPLIVDP